MKKPYFHVRDADGLILSVVLFNDPDAGPGYPVPAALPGFSHIDHPGAATFTQAGRVEGEVAHLVDGEVVWSDPVPLEQRVAAAIATIDAAGDAARTAAIGDPARALEYTQADEQARRYAAAGYTGPVPDDVASWSGPKGWTDRRAADDIIATADRWRAALSGIRRLRLAAKEEVRAAGSAGVVKTISDKFLADLRAIMGGVA